VSPIIIKEVVIAEENKNIKIRRAVDPKKVENP